MIRASKGSTTEDSVDTALTRTKTAIKAGLAEYFNEHTDKVTPEAVNITVLQVDNGSNVLFNTGTINTTGQGQVHVGNGSSSRVQGDFVEVGPGRRHARCPSSPSSLAASKTDDTDRSWMAQAHHFREENEMLKAKLAGFERKCRLASRPYKIALWTTMVNVSETLRHFDSLDPIYCHEALVYAFFYHETRSPESRQELQMSDINAQMERTIKFLGQQSEHMVEFYKLKAQSTLAECNVPKKDFPLAIRDSTSEMNEGVQTVVQSSQNHFSPISKSSQCSVSTLTKFNALLARHRRLAKQRNEGAHLVSAADIKAYVEIATDPSFAHIKHLIPGLAKHEWFWKLADGLFGRWFAGGLGGLSTKTADKDLENFFLFNPTVSRMEAHES